MRAVCDMQSYFSPQPGHDSIGGPRRWTVRGLLLIVRPIVTIVTLIAVAGGGALADDEQQGEPLVQVSFETDGETLTRAGRVVVSDKAGGILLEGRDGSLTIIEAAAVRDTRLTEEQFSPMTRDELGDQLLAELPDGFLLYNTPHYLVAYDTSLAYAKWTSSLLERLHRAFTGYWRGRGFELQEPELPLVVVIHASVDDYRKASRDELGAAVNGIVGYYSLASNRVNMYDLTGAETSRAARNERASIKTINRMLAQPSAVQLVATIVHEATHQIAFNCGLQQRFADIPLWLVEGMAVYFEAPDLSSSRGWSGIGKVNYQRLEVFRSHVPRWDTNAFRELVSSNARLRDPRSAVDAYADAWALSYYLIRYRRDEYASYLKAQQAKLPLVTGSEEDRLREFEQHFGKLETLERDFLRRMTRLQ